MKPLKLPEGRRLGAALLAAATSAICIAFLVGGFYPYFSLLLHGDRSIAGSNNDASVMTLVEIGFITAMIALPVVFALTCGVAWPLFRFWVRRGYSSLAAYVGGGVIVATIGAVIIGAAHTFGFLIGTDFWFAMLLLAVSGPVAGLVVWYVLRRAEREIRQPGATQG